MNGQMNGQMSGQMNGQMNMQMNSQMSDGMMQPMNGMNGQMMNGMNGGGMNGMMGNMNGGQWVQTPQGPMMVMWTGDSNGSCILQTPDGNQMMGQTMQMPDGTCCVGMIMPVQRTAGEMRIQLDMMQPWDRPYQCMGIQLRQTLPAQVLTPVDNFVHEPPPTPAIVARMLSAPPHVQAEGAGRPASLMRQ